MGWASALKLIDLLSMRPGSLLHLNAVTGEAGCQEAEQLYRHAGWQEGVIRSLLPDAEPYQLHNFQKLLEIPIEAQVVIRHPEGKVIEILQLSTSAWNALLGRAGSRVDVMVDGRVIAEGEIVDSLEERGIRITRMTSL